MVLHADHKQRGTAEEQKKVKTQSAKLKAECAMRRSRKSKCSADLFCRSAAPPRLARKSRGSKKQVRATPAKSPDGPMSRSPDHPIRFKRLHADFHFHRLPAASQG